MTMSSNTIKRFVNDMQGLDIFSICAVYRYTFLFIFLDILCTQKLYTLPAHLLSVKFREHFNDREGQPAYIYGSHLLYTLVLYKGPLYLEFRVTSNAFCSPSKCYFSAGVLQSSRSLLSKLSLVMRKEYRIFSYEREKTSFHLFVH